MEYEPYPVGTVCKVREWEDMEAEFGSPYSVPFGFLQKMKYMCGKTFTVKRYREANSKLRKTFSYSSMENIENGWSISHEMLIPVGQADISDKIDISDDELKAFLLN